MKKIIMSLATVAVLGTSVTAFDVFPVNELNQYVYDPSVNAGEGMFIPSYIKSRGDALIYPLFYAGNGWQSQIRVINANDAAIVAKVVFYSAKDSKELKDFNIYLSGNDEWIGKVVEENGKYYIISTDGSTPLKGNAQNPYPMASKDNPLKVEIPEGVGYIQIIGMANVCRGSLRKAKLNCESFHSQHSDLRRIYSALANIIRSFDHTENPDFTFSDGVILNKKAYAPYIKDISDYSYDDAETNNKYYLNFLQSGEIPLLPLEGDVRITNTVNGTDMVYPAEALWYHLKGSDSSLIYVEGEKANLADLAIDYNISGTNENEYDIDSLLGSLWSISSRTIDMTYGDTQDVSRNYLVLTTPLKRAIVQEALKSGKYYDANQKIIYDIEDINNAHPLFYNVIGNESDGVTSYGEVRLLAQIYNNDEMAMSAGQFSPATTPTIILKNEVSSTGTDVNDASKLPYYMKQAQQAGYTNGYVRLRSLAYKNENNPFEDAFIPGIVTQMIATDAGNAVVTNWFTPAQDKIVFPILPLD